MTQSKYVQFRYFQDSCKQNLFMTFILTDQYIKNQSKHVPCQLILIVTTDEFQLFFCRLSWIKRG